MRAGSSWRRRVLWILLGGIGAYVLAWGLVSLTILGLSVSARSDPELRGRTSELAGVNNFTVVDDKVLRGAAPSAEGYQRLAQLGVRTVVDLRAEDLSADELAVPKRYGLTVVRMPIRDGQPPSDGQIDQFISLVKASREPVFVHCGAGVGRTGSMSAAYLVGTGQTDAKTATLRSLAVGPPSLEQVVFMRSLHGQEITRPNPVVVALSRFADSPRRTWSRLTH